MENNKMDQVITELSKIEAAAAGIQNDMENEKLEYLGAVIYGNTKDVNEITGKFQLWRLD